ncbi:hypothetical protein [Prevotella sp.]|uniref:hypothetical protein n=1 Tax=Prevotella sp. TaxID=59823 RepID=UPI0025E7DABD|nr:hypothetical protein [Prevotella sp.]
MTIQTVTDYIEQLAREHMMVRHTDESPHFVNLNDDKRNTALVQELSYPAVYFESTDFQIEASSTSVSRNYTCHLEVLVHVTDTGDYAEVERALSDSSQIITDIFVRMMHDRVGRKPEHKWLLSLSPSSPIKVLPIQNAENALYGCLAEFSVPLSGCITDSLNNFKSINNNG